MECADRFLTLDELESHLQKVVLAMAMALKGHGCEEERAVEVALLHFSWAAKTAGVWPSMYAASRLAKATKV